MYTAPVILLIKAYTPATPLSVFLAAFRSLVWSKFVNSITWGKESVDRTRSNPRVEGVEEVSDSEEVESVEERVVDTCKFSK